ncbi:MAG: hypothetical protein ACRC7G_03185, partial [Beijerinckiaceae bacterium]
RISLPRTNSTQKQAPARMERLSPKWAGEARRFPPCPGNRFVIPGLCSEAEQSPESSEWVFAAGEIKR